MIKKIITAFCFIFASEVYANGNGINMPQFFDMYELLKLCASLFSVLFLVIFFSFVFKKISNINYQTNGVIKLVNSVHLGAKEKIVLLEVDKKSYLLAMSSSSITLIDTYEKTFSKKNYSQEENSFLTVFNRLLKKGNNEK